MSERQRRNWFRPLSSAASSGLLGVLSYSAPAQGTEARVDASVDAQYYTLASPFGDPILRRRRYTETLGLQLIGIGSDLEAAGPELSFKARLRLDADFGQDNTERDPENAARYIPGLERAPLDLMYAYFEGRNYFDGYVGFRAGRQYVTDVLGWWSFDGLAVNLTTPIHVAFGAYAGFEQRGGLQMLSTPRFEAQGIYRGDRRELEEGRWPSFVESSRLAPAYGVTLASAGLSWLQTELSYRAVQTRDVVYTSPFPDINGRLATFETPRTSSQRLGYALGLETATLGALGGSAVYDFQNQMLSDVTAHIDAYVQEHLTLGVAYDYYYPIFDGDSIFNWFARGGTSSALGQLRVDLARGWDAAFSGGVRWFDVTSEADPAVAAADEPSALRELSEVADVSSRYRWHAGQLSAHALLEAGGLQRRYGADIELSQRHFEGLYDTRVLLSLYAWANDLRAARDATSFTYVTGFGLFPARSLRPDARLGVDWEHSMNRLVGDRFRVLASFSMAVGP